MTSLKALVLFIFPVAMSGAALADTDSCKIEAGAKMEMDLIASNIANVSTTRTLMGGPYAPFVNIRCESDACSCDTDHTPLERYEPEHPDADENGYVNYPNINLMHEMEQMIAASKRYESAFADCKITK